MDPKHQRRLQDLYSRLIKYRNDYTKDGTDERKSLDEDIAAVGAGAYENARHVADGTYGKPSDSFSLGPFFPVEQDKPGLLGHAIVPGAYAFGSFRPNRWPSWNDALNPPRTPGGWNAANDWGSLSEAWSGSPPRVTVDGRGNVIESQRQRSLQSFPVERYDEVVDALTRHGIGTSGCDWTIGPYRRHEGECRSHVPPHKFSPPIKLESLLSFTTFAGEGIDDGCDL